MTVPDAFFVRIGGMRLRVRTVGEGQPLLLIMGIGGNLDMWRPLIKRLPERKLIMFDFPGTGGSSLPRLPPNMSLNALLVRRLIRLLGHDRVDVLGYSWGGLLAQHLAFQHPRSVRRLVLVASSVGLGGLPPHPRVMARMMTPRRYYSRKYFVKIAPEIYGGRFRRDRGLADEEANRRIGRPPSATGYTAQLLALVGYSTLPALAFVKAPVLIIAGDDDPIVPALNQRLLARLLPNVQLQMVAGGGHLVLLDSPDVSVPLVRRFLDDPVLESVDSG